MASIPTVLSLALLAVSAALSGCATIGESTQQLVTIHTISDNREIGGVGCVLSNEAGRWFTTAPGRVLVSTSKSPLAVHCSKPGAGAASEQFASRYGALDMVGNIITTAGVGYLVDGHSGAGFAYPETLTVLMYKPHNVAQNQLATVENVVW